MSYTIINLEQGSAEWKAFRLNKIGSSDASAIMDVDPWKTAYKLWEQHQTGSETKMNWAMQKGKDLEPIAREMASKRLGLDFKPVVVQNDELPWQIASLDGYAIDEEGNVITLEIKCGGQMLYEQACNGEIPIYYRCQLQHTESIIKPYISYYGVYWEGNLKLLTVERDEDFINDLLKKEKTFAQCLELKEPPAMSDRDFIVIEDSEGSKLLAQYQDLCKQEKDLKAKKDAIKDQLINLGDNRSFILDGAKIFQQVRSSYDIKAMEKEGIPVDNFKRLSDPYWTISSPRSRGIA